LIENRIISVVKLPDGRWAVQNEKDLTGLDDDDLHRMAEALTIWFQTRFDLHASRAE
jgi:hypothetical protein